MNLSYQNSMRSWERQLAFEKWQSGMVVKLLFGDNAIGKFPPLPREYLMYASEWLKILVSLINAAHPGKVTKAVEAMIMDSPKI